MPTTLDSGESLLARDGAADSLPTAGTVSRRALGPAFQLEPLRCRYRHWANRRLRRRLANPALEQGLPRPVPARARASGAA